MKKLSILILCLTLCNCHAYQQDKLNRQRTANLFEQIEQKKIERAENIEKLKVTDPVNYERIKNHKIRIGMSKEHLLLSWGTPKRKNKTCNSNGCLVQYIYSKTYVYLRNDKIKSWTASR